MRKTRIANKTQWSLQDILVQCEQGRAAYQVAMDRNVDRFMDALLAVQLARVSDALNSIDRIARLALNGEYQQKL